MGNRSPVITSMGPADARTFPDDGPGSLAGFGHRLGAFLIDGLIADVISIAVLGGWKAGTEQNIVVFSAFLLIELLFVWIAGQTPGMRLTGIAVSKYVGGRQSFVWILARTVLIATIVPALIPGGDGRWLHDRAAGTVQIRTR